MARIKLAGVTPAQADILKRFYFYYSRQPKVHEQGLRPADVGPRFGPVQHDGLQRLVSEGLVERRLDEGGARHRYWLTDLGVQKWQVLLLLAGTPRQAVLGPVTSSLKLGAFATLCTG